MSKKVLVVDDDDDIRDILVDIITSVHSAVLTACSGIEGKKMIEDHDVSILVSDLEMPGLDGLDLTRWVKLYNQDIVTVLVSGNISKLSGAPDADWKVSKPIDEAGIKILQEIMVSVSR